MRQQCAFVSVLDWTNLEFVATAHDTIVPAMVCSLVPDCAGTSTGVVLQSCIENRIEENLCLARARLLAFSGLGV